MAVITGWVNGQVSRMWRVVSGVERPSKYKQVEAEVANAFGAAAFCAAMTNVESIGENIKLSFKEIGGNFVFFGGC